MRTAGAVAGVAAAAVALAVAELTAILTGPATSPLAAVAAVVVDRAPEPMTESGLAFFGRYAKTALQAGVVGLVVAVAAGLGALVARRLAPGLACVAAFGAVGVAAAVTRPGATLSAALPSLAGAAAAAGVWWWWAPTRARPVTVEGRLADRRTVLRTAGLLVAGAAVAGVAGRWLGQWRQVAAARARVTLPVPADPAPPPAGADLGLPDLDSFVTSNDDFFRIDTAIVVPRIDPDTWRLRIHGRVRHPYTLTFEQLLARPMVERYLTLACVSNQVGGDLIGTARWLGVPLADLLRAAGPLPGADQVVGRSVDGWTCGAPTAALLDGRDALLAVGMNGEPLPLEHGFPARMVVPGLYGYVAACKWITELELASFDDFDAYWVRRGWARQAPVKLQSRIDAPRGRATAGPVTVAGVAWGHRGVAGVEVRVDDGPWRPATLAPTVSADTWVQWSWRWEATVGEHELTVRATAADGERQPEQRSPSTPDGATGWHTVTVAIT